MLIGDDTNALALVEGCSEIIDGQSVDPCTDDTDDDHAEIVNEESGAADDDTTDGH